MVVELERDADDVVAFTRQQGRDDGGVDAARHGHDDAGLRGRARQMKAVEAARRGACVARGAVVASVMPDQIYGVNLGSWPQYTDGAGLLASEARAISAMGTKINLA